MAAVRAKKNRKRVRDVPRADASTSRAHVLLAPIPKWDTLYRLLDLTIDAVF